MFRRRSQLIRHHYVCQVLSQHSGGQPISVEYTLAAVARFGLLLGRPNPLAVGSIDSSVLVIESLSLLLVRIPCMSGQFLKLRLCADPAVSPFLRN